MLFVDAGSNFVGVNTAEQTQGGTLNVGMVSGSPVVSLLSRSATDGHTGILHFMKTPATSGNYTATANGDVLGDIRFSGVNTSLGADIGAQITVTQSGTASATVPADMVFVTNEIQRLAIQGRASGSEVIFNDNSADCDFRVESDGNADMFVVNAGQNAIGIGKNNATNFGLAGSGFYASGEVNFTRDNSNALYINRTTSDGNLVQFYQAGSLEGSISISGSTVSYNGFSGLHESSGIPTNTPLGTVVSTIDELDVYASMQGEEGDEYPCPQAGQTRADHAKIKVSDTSGDACVYGVVNSFNAQGKVNVTSVGIGSVRVTGACSKGDLLESNGDGTAKVQSDDIIRSKTIGKVTIGNSNTGVKLGSCVMYCG